MRVSFITVDNTGKKHRIAIYHDIPNAQMFQAIAESWALRTDEYTAESFCEYVNKKQVGFRARPATQEEIDNMAKRD